MAKSFAYLAEAPIMIFFIPASVMRESPCVSSSAECLPACNSSI